MNNAQLPTNVKSVQIDGEVVVVHFKSGFTVIVDGDPDADEEVRVYRPGAWDGKEDHGAELYFSDVK